MNVKTLHSLQGLSTTPPSRRPAYDPVDYYKVQEAINTLLIDLQELAPAMSKTQKLQIQTLLGLGSADANTANLTMDIDEVTAQYMLVMKVRDMVLDPQQRFHEKTDAKGLTALVNAINGVINLFMRHQATIDHLKEVSRMREAVVYAISDLDAETKHKFFEKLEELNNNG